MEKNEYKKESGETEREAPHSSVEYGPSDYDDVYYKKRNRKKNGAIIVAVTVVLLLLFIGIGCCALLIRSMGQNDKTDGGTPTPDAGSGGNSEILYGGNVIVHVTEENATIKDGSVAAVVQKCDASVVEIMTTSSSVGSDGISGAGSGVIIGVDKENGYTYIVTNNHVVEGASAIRVRTSDGTEYDALQVGTDWQSDVAVIRITATGLTPAVCGRSESLVKGQDVVVIGNPFGSLGGSVTGGVLSGLGRTITIEGVPMSLLQVDAAINPGNSGGGLFDMNGNLIGVVNAKSYGDVVDDIGFAIPIDDARAVFEDILKQGYVSGRADLGFVFTGGAGLSHGLMVKSYAYGSEIGNAIASGDVLYSLTDPKGKSVVIDGAEDYKSVLARLSVGDKVTAVLYRPVTSGLFTRYSEYTVTLTVKEYKPGV